MLKQIKCCDFCERNESVCRELYTCSVCNRDVCSGCANTTRNLGMLFCKVCMAMARELSDSFADMIRKNIDPDWVKQQESI
jgi:hypothetical protein